MKKTIYLLRHCEATGQEPDAKLTEKGKEQAKEIACFFENQPIKHIISSPFARAIQSIEPTANILRLQLQIDNRLMERRLVSQTTTGWLKRIAASIKEKEIKMATGESSQDITTSLFEVLESANDGTVISTHGNMIGLILNQIDGLSGFKEWIELSHPDVYKLIVEKEEYCAKRIWS